MKRTLLIIVFFVLNSVSTLNAEEIRVINRTELPLKIWFQKRGEETWTYPQLIIEPNKESLFHFQGEGLYYVVTQTLTCESGQQILGWIDFHKLKIRSAAASLIIDGRFVTRTKEVLYTVVKPVHETRVRERSVKRWKMIDGRCVLVPEVITEEYVVTSYVPENRVKTIVYNILRLNANAKSDEGPLMCHLTFKTEKDGAFIRYQLAAREEKYISDNPTTSTQNIPVGIYFMWSERKGKQTSQKGRYDIYEQERTITIPEGEQPYD